ncbi:PIN domain-containing protein [Paucibacter sp. APW11]|uniref:PIN domain-containing protein n=1 Tax=Roseateles aquae TaxID=3077235 RepID=A0ABU3PGG6_9BURK|nr:PIN domain-containing protein [Paucibacter sp. APW11]MDT9001593.1 PIN domain-containing protein [Paucibacter sp. APW11]
MSRRPSRSASRAAVPRLVIDHALLLRALLLSDERSRALRQSWQQGRCRPLISADLAQTLMRALAFPGLRLRPGQQHELLADFLPYAEACTAATPALGSRLPREEAAALELAVAASADVLLTEGQALRAHLARWGEQRYGRLRAESLDEFLARF